MRKRRIGVLQVDKNRPVRGKSAKGAQVLNTDGYIWIGKIFEMNIRFPTFCIMCIHLNLVITNYFIFVIQWPIMFTGALRVFFLTVHLGRHTTRLLNVDVLCHNVCKRKCLLFK